MRNPPLLGRAPLLCFFLVSFVFAATLCYADVKSVEVVGVGECVDCKESNIKTSHALSGLKVAIDCKSSDGNFKTRGIGELNEEGKFTILLPNAIVEDGKLKEECYAQLYSAAANPCPAHDDLQSSKIVLLSKSDEKHTFGLSGKLKISPGTCTSAFLWPFFKYPPLSKFPQFPLPLPLIPKFHHPHLKHFVPPFSFPPLPPKVFTPFPPKEFPPTPVYEKPLPPPVPVYEKPVPPPTPVYEKPLPPPVPVYEKPPLPPPVYEKPLPPPVYVKPNPPPVPIYKKPLPPPVPVYKKPCPPPVPVYKKPNPPPKYEKPLPPPVPVYKKPNPPPVPVYKKPLPPPVPIYKKPLPPPVPIYKHPFFKHKHPFFKHLPHIPKIPHHPFFKKPWPPIPHFPPVPKFPPKYFSHHKFGGFDKHPPSVSHP
uniref:Proline-rich protein 4-like n=1 Tax=Cucumis melo TaxID=3656 RepID=A0A9I9DM93_CUCME